MKNSVLILIALIITPLTVLGEAKDTGSLDSVRSRIDSLDQALASARESSGSVRVQINGLDQVLSTFQVALESALAQVDSLDQALASARKRIGQLQGELKGLKQPIEAEPGAAKEEEQPEVQEEEVEDKKVPAEPQIVTISEAVGEEIDLQERNRYGLFKKVQRFVSASYFKQPDGSYTIKMVVVDESGNEVEKVNPVTYAGIEYARAKIKAHKD